MLQAEYERRLRVGVAKEQARKDLPLSTYTEAYWKIDLHNLMHFLSLRMDAHAQLEIRSYADIIGNQILACWMPMTWRAFYDYRLTARSFSGPEMELIRGLLVKGNPFESGDEDRILRKALLNQRERQEFLTKIGTS
jgi:thymidylate synthase (FAD)